MDAFFVFGNSCKFVEQISLNWFSKQMAIEERRKIEPKNQKLIIVIICCIGVFILPFVSDSQISIPGFSYTPSVGGQIVDKNGRPLSGAYILYDYHGYTPGTLGGSSPDYIKNPTIVVTDTNGQFAIPSLSFKKPLGYGRPKLNILAGYSPITHSAFSVNTSGNHQKITLQDNTNDPRAWEKDLNALAGGYGQLVFDNELGKIKNGEEVEAMLQSEHRPLNLAFCKSSEAKIASGDLDGAIADKVLIKPVSQRDAELADELIKIDVVYYKKLNAEIASGNFNALLTENNNNEIVLFDPRYVDEKVKSHNAFLKGVYDGIDAKVASGDLDGAIADYTKIIKIFPRNNDFYVRRGEIEKKKGDLDAAQADFRKTALTNGFSTSITNSK